jgi:NADPH:quinone reductase-like Zn-dependent oxidoreductase
MSPNSQITGNVAAWLPYEKAPAMQIGPGPTPNPGENEVVIEVAYVAINPTDHLVSSCPVLPHLRLTATQIQDAPYFKLPYPWIEGSDVAGTIVQLGSKVTRFTIGQRVIGQSDALLTQKPANATFQRFTTCREILVAAIPDSLPLANAVVLPLCFGTATAALFVNLKLRLPTLEPVPSGETILIWGGSSSVGLCAIQCV